jgi:hypothetical protein
MIADKGLAREVSDRILEVNRILNEMAMLVTQRDEHGEAKSFCLAVGHVSAELLFEIANPLYQAHPDLKPVGMG